MELVQEFPFSVQIRDARSDEMVPFASLAILFRLHSGEEFYCINAGLHIPDYPSRDAPGTPFMPAYQATYPFIAQLPRFGQVLTVISGFV